MITLLLGLPTSGLPEKLENLFSTAHPVDPGHRCPIM
jgi:hypothetical protein